MGLRQYPTADLNVSCAPSFPDHKRRNNVGAFTTDNWATLNPSIMVRWSRHARVTTNEELHAYAWALMAHEYGHAFGLDHTADGIMAGVVRSDQTPPVFELDETILCPLAGRCTEDK